MNLNETQEIDKDQIDGGRVEYVENHYKIRCVKDDVRFEICNCFDCNPPLTPMEKAQYPFKRNYPDE